MAVSGNTPGVPRLDRWLHAAGIVERYDSVEDFDGVAAVASVGSNLSAGEARTDTSARVCKNLLTCLEGPLRWRDFQVLQNATCMSVGMDEQDGILLVYA